MSEASDQNSVTDGTDGFPANTRVPILGRILRRMPTSCQLALYYETFSSVGTGAFITIFSISLLVLESILQAPLLHQAMLAMFFFGSNFLSPMVTYVGRKIPMHLLVIVPNLVVGGLLFLIASPWGGSLFFTLVMGACFFVRVFPRVAEMNMFRVLYPETHRSTAVGWTKAIAAFSGFGITVLSLIWFAVDQDSYAGLYLFVAILLVTSVWYYSRIPIPDRSTYLRDDDIPPIKAFGAGVREFFTDRRFLLYQFGFALAGIANFLSLWLIPDVIRDHVLPHAFETGHALPFWTVGFGAMSVELSVEKLVMVTIVAVMPVFFVILSSPLWGRYMDGRNPMYARAVFNALQMIAYLMYCLGGVTLQIWPFFVGTTFHAIANGGGTINWLTGSMYFARSEHVSLYNGLHVFLTGLRGMLGPVIGFLLVIDQRELGDVVVKGAGLGAWVFLISAILSLFGMIIMLIMHLLDTGPREACE